jgi:hypothetical protein
MQDEMKIPIELLALHVLKTRYLLIEAEKSTKQISLERWHIMMADEAPTSCANCSKAEEIDAKLEACAACRLVKYCGRDCQIAHRSQPQRGMQEACCRIARKEAVQTATERRRLPNLFCHVT